jgi:hypothetical protein
MASALQKVLLIVRALPVLACRRSVVHVNHPGACVLTTCVSFAAVHLEEARPSTLMRRPAQYRKMLPLAS